MKNDDDLTPRLPAPLRAKYLESQNKFASPTVLNLKAGDPESLRKLTPEAARLGQVAEGCISAWRDVDRFHWRSMADATLTPGAQLDRSASYGRERLKGATGSVDRAFDDGEARARQLRAIVETAWQPPTNAGRAMADAQTRDRLARMTPAEQSQALRDPMVRAAAVSAPAMVSGLPIGVWSEARREHAEATVPNEWNQLQDLADAMEAATKAAATIEKEINALIDFPSADLLLKQKVDA